MWLCRSLLRLLLLLLVIVVPSFFLSRAAAAAASAAANICPVSSAASLDSIIRGHAFRAVARPGRRSGVVYRVPLPAELSGVEAAAVKLRGGSFWRDGANVNSFRIPKKTFSVPFARRMVLVYQNLGNWSSCYHDVRGYSPATPVVCLLAYDGSRTGPGGATARELELKAAGEPISVAFPYVRLPEGLNSSLVRCARFGAPRGSAELYDARGWHGCSATNAGHFVMVFPSSEVTVSLPPPPPPPQPPSTPLPSEGGRTWPVWLIACGCGVVGGVALVLLAAGVSELVKRRRMREMERNSEEGVVLDTMWVGGGSKMPSASMTRTQPVLEDGSSP